jgi:hypothetical protein
MQLATLVQAGGALQISLLVASAFVPVLFNWRGELAKVTQFVRRLMWVYGAFVVLMVAGFGLLSLFWSADLASGAPLGRAVSGFIAIVWLVRLGVQFFVFDVKGYITQPLLLVGYHGLTLVFVYLVAVFGWAAIGG